MRKPRPHWTQKIVQEAEQLRRENDELRNAHHMQRFAREVGENLMLMLANKPYAQWPELAKIAFNHAKDRQETTAYLYQQRLPKA